MRFAQTLILISVLSFAIYGQTNKGGISGAVTDAAGAIIPGATVTVTNVGTNNSTTVATSHRRWPR